VGCVRRSVSGLVVFAIASLFVVCLLLCPSSEALAGEQDEQTSSEAESGDDQQKSEGEGKDSLFKRYKCWLKHHESVLLGADLWGASATIPQGYLVGAFGWGTMRPYGRFDENRELVPLLPILSFPDPWGSEDKFLEFDFNIRGSGNAYFLSAMYGITDRLMAGVSTGFVTTEIKLDPKFTPGTIDKIGVATLEDFYRVMEALGRPRPETYYKTDGVDWSDTSVSVTWNYYRTSWFSTAATPIVYLPTAHQADPNKNLVLGLGPDIDTGYGAWGVGATLPFDFKVFELGSLLSVTLTLTGEGAYFFRATRKSPDFLPIDQDVRDYLESQGVDMDLFQDLTDMGDTYYYTPGPWAAASLGVSMGPLSVAYRHGWAWAGKYESDSPGFESMIDYIGLVGEGDDGKLIVSLSVPLTPIYIPGLVQGQFQYQTDGRNTMVFRDQWGAGVGFMVPLAIPERYKMKEGSEQ